jgi:hypothetical protein
MLVPRTLRGRLLASTAIALSCLLGASGVALADTESGQHGHYVFTDDVTNRGVVCVYAGSNPYRLVRLVIKAPAVWWWDANSSSATEHGRVGWRAIVQVSLPGAYGPFNTVLKSSIQKATAYEDQPPYDLNDKAPLTRKRLDFDPAPYKSQPNAYVRVDAKALWYRPNGSAAGWVRHTIFNYTWRNIPGMQGSTTACPIRVWPAAG